MSIPTEVILFVDNDLYVEIDGLHDGLTPTSYFNAATVSATLRDSTGTAVTGATNITLNYVPASNGKYIGSIQESFNPPIGSGYKLEITAIQSGIQGKWTIKAKVKIRTGQDE